MTRLTLDFRGAMPGVAEEYEVREHVHRSRGQDSSLFWKAFHSRMAHFAGIHLGKARALSCLRGGVAEPAIQPQSRMPLVAECDLAA
jgi:hypothetical protein